MLTDESALPRQVLVNSILVYLDLCSLIKFSCTSKRCKEIVFHDVSKTRWRVIDLSGNSRLTDEQLSILLENINARENTRVLSIVGCPSVEGVGLEPLWGSRVMEDIDLRVRGSLPLKGDMGKYYGRSGLSEECVARILRSMLPRQDELGGGDRDYFALRRVAIRPRRDTRDNNPGRRRMELKRRLLDYGPAIGNFYLYHDSLRQNLSPIDPRSCNGPDSCSLCGVSYNRAVVCDSCNARFCISCAMPQNCSECNKTKCQWCSTLVTCSSCDRRSCASHGYEGCGVCEVVFCQDCHVDKLDFSITRNEYHCLGCAPSMWGGNIR